MAATAEQRGQKSDALQTHDGLHTEFFHRRLNFRTAHFDNSQRSNEASGKYNADRHRAEVKHDSAGHSCDCPAP